MKKKRKNRFLSLLLACIMVFGISVPFASEVHAAGSIVKEGDIPIPGSRTEVGKFLVDGQRAFCLEHKRNSPPDRATLESTAYGNENVRKALYYGWGGPEQWNGFKNENHGIMITSLVLSYFYDRSSLGGDYGYLDGFDEFIAFVNKKPAPPTHVIKFNKTALTARWDTESQMQVTDTVSVTGSKGDTLSFTVPDGITLVKNNKIELTGKVTLTVGDTFYLKAKSSVSGTYETGDVGKAFKYQALVFIYRGKVQDIGQIRRISDPAENTSLSVKWLDMGTLELYKTDEEGNPLSGAEFVIKSKDPAAAYEQEIKIKDGKAVMNLLPGDYIVTEVKAANGYVNEDLSYEITIAKGETTTITVENKKTKVTVSKVDATTGEELKGATLQIIDPETHKVVEEWVSTTEPRIVKGLTDGKEYILRETIAPKTYEVQTQEIKFTVGSDEKVVMKDEPIKITGEIDKRQTYFEQDASYCYSIDYRSTSNVWADEYNMIDTIDCAINEYAQLTSLKTPVASGDHDGKMNVWYKTNLTPADYVKDAEKYNACSTNPDNPWNPDRERVQDYTGWKIWKEGVSTLQSETLDVTELKLEDGEYITGIAFEHGRVEKGFTTRLSDWDREDIKSTDDTVKEIKFVHDDTFSAESGEVNYEPAVMYMKVTSREAAQNLKPFWNSAEINIYRNLGDHPDLEDDDEDKVVQKYPIGSIEMEDFDKLFSDESVQTGDARDISDYVVAGLLSALAMLAIFITRKKWSIKK